jgi:hypothetical protein
VFWYGGGDIEAGCPQLAGCAAGTAVARVRRRGAESIRRIARLDRRDREGGHAARGNSGARGGMIAQADCVAGMDFWTGERKEAGYAAREGQAGG